ncbi:hypothetical protein [Arenimonas sp. MALMAid1274]|uniref:hypothetical protein n=1 Tax=Arenimonas sp. MALMAid1274 TaxID=3411630 RepID=UPI003BA2995C
MAPPALSKKHERELADAEAGKLEWVSPAVAAHMLGITPDALAKRRKQGSEETPTWKQAKEDGKVFYRWDYFHRIQPAQKSELDLLKQKVASLEAKKSENDLLKQKVASLEAKLDELLRRRGMSLLALNTMALWAVNADDLVVGHAAVSEGMGLVGYTWLEALAAPWVSEGARHPYDAAVVGLLNEARLHPSAAHN